MAAPCSMPKESQINPNPLASNHIHPIAIDYFVVPNAWLTLQVKGLADAAGQWVAVTAQDQPKLLAMMGGEIDCGR